MSKKQQQEQQQLDPQRAFDEVLAKRLSATIFETDDSERELLAFLMQPAILEQVSIAQLVGNSQNYERLIAYTAGEEINMLDVSFFLNLPEKLSPVQAGKTLAEYVEFLNSYVPMIERWNKLVIPMRTAAMKEVQALMTRKIIIPPNNLKITSKNN